MMERNHSHISISRQAELLSVSRTSVYRAPVDNAVDFRTVGLMHLIDALYTACPFYGYRRMTAALRRDGILVNKKRVRRLMREMGIEAIYPGPNLSRRFQRDCTRPYLLRHLKIDHINQVWGIDITYLRMEKGFMYLFVIVDWFSRKIVDYELSSTLEKAFVMTCLRRALQGVKPEIINSDQGSHFTNPDYLSLMTESGVRVSMDGKGRATDNGRTERFFRSLKYERIYLMEHENPQHLRRSVKEYIHYYNTDRPHQCNDYASPDTVYNLLVVDEAS